MSARNDFLMRLAVTCQLADERAEAQPENRMAQRFAEGVRALFLDALVLPEGHALFENGAAGASFALQTRTRAAQMSWVA